MNVVEDVLLNLSSADIMLIIIIVVVCIGLGVLKLLQSENYWE